jgi:ribosome-associated protein
MGHDRLVRALLAGVAACTAAPQAAKAQAQPQARQQAWPQKAVRIIVPQSPGGSTDAMARLLELIARACVRPKRRVATRPTAGSRERRLSDKKAQGSIKRNRAGGRGSLDD